MFANAHRALRSTLLHFSISVFNFYKKMDPNTVISVVVPLQNDAKLISKMVEDLDRVMEASFRFFELILVDDG